MHYASGAPHAITCVSSASQTPIKAASTTRAAQTGKSAGIDGYADGALVGVRGIARESI